MREVGDALCTGVAWLPGLALLTGTALAVTNGILFLESTFGATSYLL